jgi:hypothetical protein
MLEESAGRIGPGQVSLTALDSETLVSKSWHTKVEKTSEPLIVIANQFQISLEAHDAGIRECSLCERLALS